jgi:hypothetical protein
MKKYGGMDVETQVFLTSALVEVNVQLHVPAALLPGKEPEKNQVLSFQFC